MDDRGPANTLGMAVLRSSHTEMLKIFEIPLLSKKPLCQILNDLETPPEIGV